MAENNEDIPNLSEKQKRFLNKLKSEVNKIIDLGSYVPEDDAEADEILIRLTLIQDNLSIIINQFNRAPNARRKFIDNYTPWHEFRIKSIKNLRKIAESMKDKKFWFNVTKTASAVASVAGGASVLLAPVTGGVALAAGNIVSGAGVAVSAGVSALEFTSLRDDILNAQKFLEEDKKLFLMMSEFLDRTTKLQSALSEILEIDAVKKMLDHVKDLVVRAMEIQDENEQLRYIREKVSDILNLFASDDKIPPYYALVLTTALVTICLLMSDIKHQITFECALLVAKGSLDVVRLACFFGAFSVSRQASRWITGVGMVVDLAILTLTAIDLYNGSPCSQADKILEVVDSLEKEAHDLERVYYETKNILNRPF